MHPFRRVAPALILPLLVMIDRGAFYGLRAVTWEILSYGADWESAQIADLWIVQGFVTIGLTVAGGVLAVVAGPLPVLVVGFALATLGYGLVPAFEGEMVTVPVIVASAGVGLARPAIWAAALLPFARPHESLRNGLCMLLWAAMNVSSLVAFPVADELRRELGAEGVCVVSAIFAGFGTVLAAVLALGWFFTTAPPEEGAEPPPTTVFHGPTFGIAVGLVLLFVLPWHGMQSHWASLSGLLWDSPPGTWSSEFWVGLNPVVVMWAGAVGAAGFFALALLRRNVPAALVIGVGLVLAGAGIGMLSFEVVRESWGWLCTAIVLLSVGEVIAGPLLISRIGGDLHWRLTTLVVAAWIGLGNLVYLGIDELLELAALAETPFAVSGAAVLVGIPLGIALIVAAYPLQRRFYAPDTPDALQRPVI